MQVLAPPLRGAAMPQAPYVIIMMMEWMLYWNSISLAHTQFPAYLHIMKMIGPDIVKASTTLPTAATNPTRGASMRSSAERVSKAYLSPIMQDIIGYVAGSYGDIGQAIE
jgi:hypothetical protein